MVETQQTLEKIFNGIQVDAPPELHGILHTTNYNDFQLLNDVGDVIHTFTGAVHASKCLSGDHVAWKENRCTLELRYEHPLIVGTLELTSKTTYGVTKRGYPMYLFTPYDASYPAFVVGSSEKNRSANRIVLVAFESWTGTFPRGTLNRILGVSGEYDAEYQALIWQASPYVYSTYDYQPEKKEDVRTEVEGVTFNIDPAGCQDIDDVFTFLKKDSGWLVTITISDVACYVEDGTAIDIMASLIGQTLYSAEGTILRPMLPSAYQETCSLKPGKKSYGISLQFVWNNGQITDSRWFESELINNKTYTYEDYPSNAEFPLQEIASHLAGKPLDDSHAWVEQMMLFYNKEAGRMLKSAAMGLLRKHSAPNRQKLEQYKEHLPELEHIAYAAAEYCLAEDSDSSHYGLGSHAYTHATSPIRRYADLINQRVLKLLLRGTGERYIVPISMVDMRQREKAIKRFARDADFVKAITDGTACTGIIMDKQMHGDKMKLKLYVREWKRMITVWYRAITEDIILSRDEKTQSTVKLYQDVHITYAVMMNERNWKNRMVIVIT